MNDAWLSLMDWQWRQPETLWFLAVPLVVSLFLFWRQRRHWQGYADAALLPWIQVNPDSAEADALKTDQAWFQRVRKALFHPGMGLAIAWVALVIALAGPRTLVQAPQQSDREGVDILIAVDVSRSMQAEDVRPDRFHAARNLVESVLPYLKADDRVGLVVFAAQPHLVSPLSFDRDWTRHYLGLMQTGMLPTHGSHLGQAMVFGARHLDQVAGEARALWVLTDGPAQPPLKSNEEEKQKAFELPQALPGEPSLLITGMGRSSDTFIPDDSEMGGRLLHLGQPARTRLQEGALQTLAEQFDGTYLRGDGQAGTLADMVTTLTQPGSKRPLPTTDPKWEDHSLPFVWLAFVTMLAAMYPLSVRRRAKSEVASVALMALSAALGLTTLMQPTQVQAEPASENPHQAFAALQNKDYDTALKLYQGLDGYDAQMGAGVAAYYLPNLTMAVASFREALMQAKTDPERGQALFNLGNSYLQADLLVEAIEAYQHSLRYAPDREATEHNLAVAQARLDSETELRSPETTETEQGERRDQDPNRQQDENAFYGGMSAGGGGPSGMEDELDQGIPDGEKKTDPALTGEATDYRLDNRALSLTTSDSGQAVLADQAKRRRIAVMNQTLESVQDDQAGLLKRLFEREEGFQAEQEEGHDLPGVVPW
ncbi:VWA domain-containing protein [Hydrogenovibrio halophilus]|uniref:VWA domain-containing protein n=1 Tax=Hydrogenovibrio halophilus TaxID=373391 RepID=UPI0003640758|nr:VWA domain-containing protein [Hydrogenovibrio halophilus]